MIPVWSRMFKYQNLQQLFCFFFLLMCESYLLYEASNTSNSGKSWPDWLLLLLMVARARINTNNNKNFQSQAVTQIQ